MTISDELEKLTGAPVKAFSGDPMTIPCHERSDAERLCAKPVVSVHMVTYNHEPYIARAIEGVMMQKTDFEFELVIGDDASTDKTREICFDYQAKYPERIRVLWGDENLYRNSHPAGRNAERNIAHCRGEFIAWCEGDDYWTDPNKLQDQVDFLRAHPESMMCVADCEWQYPDIESSWDYPRGARVEWVFGGDKRLLSLEEVSNHYFHTSTYLVRTDAYRRERQERPDIVYWYDILVQLCLAECGPVCYLPKKVSVYNWTGNGAAGSPGSRTSIVLQATQFIQFALSGPIALRERYVGRVLSHTIGAIVRDRGKLELKDMERLLAVASDFLPRAKDASSVNHAMGLLLDEIFLQRQKDAVEREKTAWATHDLVSRERDDLKRKLDEAWKINDEAMSELASIKGSRAYRFGRFIAKFIG